MAFQEKLVPLDISARSRLTDVVEEDRGPALRRDRLRPADASCDRAEARGRHLRRPDRQRDLGRPDPPGPGAAGVPRAERHPGAADRRRGWSPTASASPTRTTRACSTSSGSTPRPPRSWAASRRTEARCVGSHLPSRRAGASHGATPRPSVHIRGPSPATRRPRPGRRSRHVGFWHHYLLKREANDPRAGRIHEHNKGVASMASADVHESTTSRAWSPSLGAWPGDGGAHFRVWAPRAREIDVVVMRAGREPRAHGRSRRGRTGTSSDSWPGHGPGIGIATGSTAGGRSPTRRPATSPRGSTGPRRSSTRARFAGPTRAGGASRRRTWSSTSCTSAPSAPRGPSTGVAKRLETLRDLGVTAIELMPVADFAGCRNWGYDGVDLFAPARCYGTPDDLRRLVDEAHRLGLGGDPRRRLQPLRAGGQLRRRVQPAVPHLPRESAWAACVNLDGEGSEQVRAVLHRERPALAARVPHRRPAPGRHARPARRRAAPLPRGARRRGSAKSLPDRWIPLIAEDHRNLDTMIRPRWAGGWDLDGVWADDFHHQVRRHLAGDDEGYYRDYTGTTADLATTINQGWFYTGQHSIHLDEPRGTDPAGIEPRRFVDLPPEPRPGRQPGLRRAAAPPGRPGRLPGRHAPCC